MTININQLMASSGVLFGTSGVRGRVIDMSDQLCFAYVTAFLSYLTEQNLVKKNAAIGIAGDLRSSTPRIMNAVAAACIDKGFKPINYGHIPSPALALIGLKNYIATIMVTGSHIPDDRNGIKFNTPLGEILKPDEDGIRRQNIVLPVGLFSEQGSLLSTDYLPIIDHRAEQHYIRRFTDFLPKNCLQGHHIGLYEHSSVARDCIKNILQRLGAKVTSLARSEQFIAVDTEAIRAEDIALAKQWTADHSFDCVISSDGDGDRPLVSDEQGNWLRGDIAAMLCAFYLQADTVVTPVSSNSVVEQSHYFNQVVRTKIGSPYVIEAMQQLSKDNSRCVVAYEANGGFLQQTPILHDDRLLAALPTRDAIIVPLSVILLAKQQHSTIAELVKTLPQRYTYSDRIKGFATALSQQMIANMVKGELTEQLATIKSLFTSLAEPRTLDVTDGLRITLNTGDIVHLRPSGNAPELRCYTEAASPQQAEQLNSQVIKIVKQLQAD